MAGFFGNSSTQNGMLSNMAPMPVSPYGELRAYEPTLRDKLASFLLQGANRGGAWEHAVKGLIGSRGIGNEGAGLVNYTPAGLPFSVDETVRAAQNNSPMGVLQGGLGIAGNLLPMGGAGAKMGAAATGIIRNEAMDAGAKGTVSALESIMGRKLTSDEVKSVIDHHFAAFAKNFDGAK